MVRNRETGVFSTMVRNTLEQGCRPVFRTMVRNRGVPDLYTTYTSCWRTPVAGVGYDGRKLTPAVAPTHDDDNREVRRTEEGGIFDT